MHGFEPWFLTPEARVLTRLDYIPCPFVGSAEAPSSLLLDDASLACNETGVVQGLLSGKVFQFPEIIAFIPLQNPCLELFQSFLKERT